MSSENVQLQPLTGSGEYTTNNESTPHDNVTPFIDQTDQLKPQPKVTSEDTETEQPSTDGDVTVSNSASKISELISNQVDEEEGTKEESGDEQGLIMEDFREEAPNGTAKPSADDTEDEEKTVDDEETNEDEATGGEQETITEEEETTGQTQEDFVSLQLEVAAAEGGSDFKLGDHGAHSVAFGEGATREPEPDVARPQGRRKSMGLVTVPRFKSIDATGASISGDFKALGSDLEMDLKFDALIDESEYEQYEEGSAEKEPAVVDREAYYELNNVYEKLYNKAKLRNNFLQRKLADYYKKRRMYHVLKESEYQSDTQQKYERKLDALEAISDINTKERARIREELGEMKTTRSEKAAELAKLFETMQRKEGEIGKDLMTASMAKTNLEKIVERLLRRQRSQMASVIKMRLQFIKIRNRVNEKNSALRALDNLGSHLHLIDYEQLKVDNRNHQDKLEERDNELIRLRARCQNSMQILAHKREKSSAVETEMLNLAERHESVDADCDSAREQLNYLKQERDWYRHQTNKLKEESGLLMKPKLLRDMEDAIKEVEVFTKKLQDITEEYNTVSEQVRVVRLHIEKANDKKLVTPKKRSSLCKGRPSLMANQDWNDDHSLI